MWCFKKVNTYLTVHLYKLENAFMQKTFTLFYNPSNIITYVHKRLSDTHTIVTTYILQAC